MCHFSRFFKILCKKLIKFNIEIDLICIYLHLQVDQQVLTKYYSGLKQCTYRPFFSISGDLSNVKFGDRKDASLTEGTEIKVRILRYY